MSAATSIDHPRSGRGRHRRWSKETKRKEVPAKAELNAEERVLDALVGARRARRRAKRSASGCAPASSTTRRSRSRSPRRGGGLPTFDIPGMPGASIGVINIGEMLGKAIGQPHQERAASPSRTATTC